MKSLQEVHRHKQLAWLLSVAAVIILLAGGVWWGLHRNQSLNDKADQTGHQQSKVAPRPIAIESKILVTGNTFWGRYVDDWSMASDLKYKYPFSRLNEFERDKYNAWVTGLECPTVPGLEISSATMDETLEFNCKPEYLKEAAKWFDIVTLANNHTDNQGPEGFAVTQKLLSEHKIQYFGHYDPRAQDDICDVKSLPVRVTYDDKSANDGLLPVAFCGYHGVFRVPSQEAIDLIKEYSLLMPVIAMPHMGVEYVAMPDQLKTDIYRRLIDAGADMVLGDHPHWIQSTEAYQGKLIAYSLGNFMFDQQDTLDVTRSAAVQVVLDSQGASSESLAGWLKVGEGCQSYQNDCLGQARERGLDKLDIKYQFGVIGTDGSDKITRPASAAQTEQIKQRLKWNQTMSGLKDPYGPLKAGVL